MASKDVDIKNNCNVSCRCSGNAGFISAKTESVTGAGNYGYCTHEKLFVWIGGIKYGLHDLQIQDNKEPKKLKEKYHRLEVVTTYYHNYGIGGLFIKTPLLIGVKSTKGGTYEWYENTGTNGDNLTWRKIYNHSGFPNSDTDLANPQFKNKLDELACRLQNIVEINLSKDKYEVYCHHNHDPGYKNRIRVKLNPDTFHFPKYVTFEHTPNSGTELTIGGFNIGNNQQNVAGLNFPFKATRITVFMPTCDHNKPFLFHVASKQGQTNNRWFQRTNGSSWKEITSDSNFRNTTPDKANKEVRVQFTELTKSLGVTPCSAPGTVQLDVTKVPSPGKNETVYFYGNTPILVKKVVSNDLPNVFLKYSHTPPGDGEFTVSTALIGGSQIGTMTHRKVQGFFVYFWTGNDNLPILVGIKKSSWQDGSDQPKYYSKGNSGYSHIWTPTWVSGMSEVQALDDQNCSFNGAIPVNLNNPTNPDQFLSISNKSSCLKNYKKITRSTSTSSPPNSDYTVQEYNVSGGYTQISRVTYDGRDTTGITLPKDYTVSRIRVYSYPGNPGPPEIPLMLQFIPKGNGESKWFESNNTSGTDWGTVNVTAGFYNETGNQPTEKLTTELDEIACSIGIGVTMDISFRNSVQDASHKNRYCCRYHSDDMQKISVEKKIIQVNDRTMDCYRHQTNYGTTLSGIKYYENSNTNADRKRIKLGDLTFPIKDSVKIYALYCGGNPALIYLDYDGQLNVKGWYKRTPGDSQLWNNLTSELPDQTPDNIKKCGDEYNKLVTVLNEFPGYKDLQKCTENTTSQSSSLKDTGALPGPQGPGGELEQGAGTAHGKAKIKDSEEVDTQPKGPNPTLADEKNKKELGHRSEGVHRVLDFVSDLFSVLIGPKGDRAQPRSSLGPRGPACETGGQNHDKGEAGEPPTRPPVLLPTPKDTPEPNDLAQEAATPQLQENSNSGLSQPQNGNDQSPVDNHQQSDLQSLSADNQFSRGVPDAPPEVKPASEPSADKQGVPETSQTNSSDWEVIFGGSATVVSGSLTGLVLQDGNFIIAIKEILGWYNGVLSWMDTIGNYNQAITTIFRKVITSHLPNDITNISKIYLIHQNIKYLGLGSILLVKESECLLKRWCDSHLPEVFVDFTGKNQKSTMKVAFLDVGFVHSTFFVAEISESDGQFEHKILSEKASDEIGTYQIIETIGDHICELTGESIKIPSRHSFYIFKSSTKALKELSVLNDVKIDVERILADDEDFTTTLARTKLEELTAHIQEKLQAMIESVLPESLDDLLGMEVLGGGSRIPFVKAVAEKALGKRGFTRPLRTSMDTTSAVAYGATKLALSGTLPSMESPLPDEYRRFLDREALLKSIEDAELQKQSLLNEIDNYIIKTKNDAQEDYKGVLDLEKAEPLLYDLENFASEAIMDKTIDWQTCSKKLEECKAKVEQEFPEYIKLKEEKERQHQEEATESSSMPEVNMDVTLPNSVCIKRANKNKEEGNVLVSAGNVELAAQHYIRAIQYCSKVSNVTEEEQTTLSELKMTTNLNLAMCYLKMETKTSLNKVVSCCSVALDIRPNHPKALFRRALAYEKLNELEKAIGDAEFGLTAHPDNTDLKNTLSGTLDSLVIFVLYKREELESVVYIRKRVGS
ncbi:hypothetical protein BEWA_028440 [Theileria equi strain WA]|uniref:peptidylprolyl isomerase n=1 Tax=Theileria equi strain WA TaxID=1537102 RepID=L0AYN4_THEEQ|nr:hypothetical protein BEWA_028440 [Theileria equi strain WA]AFZ79994.1 hypothetical protein BEWA_028440 [Theileria equi strain WA]|eukprot:XP_004829660.1 hypothetical protein BEWA_028440 [Theileria equi strain WA]